MSFLKFWGSSKKGSKKDEAGAKHGAEEDPELEKRRLRHSLSISRSGRFKQRKRERSQIMDKPEIFDGQDGGSSRSASTSSAATTPGSSSACSSVSSLASNADNNRNNNIGGGNSGMATHNYHNSNSNAAANFSRSAHQSSPKFTCRNINGAPPGGHRMGHPVVT